MHGPSTGGPSNKRLLIRVFYLGAISQKMFASNKPREADMMRPNEHLSMLDQSSPAPELMVRMMDQMAVNWTMAARMDGGLAWYAARSKCVFCVLS